MGAHRRLEGVFGWAEPFGATWLNKSEIVTVSHAAARVEGITVGVAPHLV